MKIVYAYGKMFILHPSGFTTVHERDDVVGQRIVEQEMRERANSRIIDLDKRIEEIDKSISDESTEPVKEGFFTRLKRRLKNEVR